MRPRGIATTDAQKEQYRNAALVKYGGQIPCVRLLPLIEDYERRHGGTPAQHLSTLQRRFYLVRNEKPSVSFTFADSMLTEMDMVEAWHTHLEDLYDQLVLSSPELPTAEQREKLGGRCKKGHLLDEQTSYFHPDGRRIRCRSCASASRRAYKSVPVVTRVHAGGVHREPRRGTDSLVGRAAPPSSRDESAPVDSAVPRSGGVVSLTAGGGAPLKRKKVA